MSVIHWWNNAIFEVFMTASFLVTHSRHLEITDNFASNIYLVWNLELTEWLKFWKQSSVKMLENDVRKGLCNQMFYLDYKEVFFCNERKKLFKLALLTFFEMNHVVARVFLNPFQRSTFFSCKLPVHHSSPKLYSPVSWGCKIHLLHLPKLPIHPHQPVSWIWHQTIWWWSSNPEALRNVECFFIAITPRSTHTWYVSTC